MDEKWLPPMDVMFYEVFREEGEAIRRHLPRDIRAEFTDETIQAAHHERAPARLISIRTQSVIPVEWSAELSGVLTRSTGFDHLSLWLKKTGRPVPCGYLPSYCARAVAEHTLLVVLTLLRKLKKGLEQFAFFRRDGITGRECGGRSLLVVGVGHIGKEIVHLGRALGMHVRGVDLVKRLDGLECTSLEEGMALSDIIVCALPLTDRTRGMFHYDLFRRAPRGAIFVNISRGEISPLKDLKRLLEEGILGGIGLDVHENESAVAESLRGGKKKAERATEEILSLSEKDNVVFTPHNAFNTEEALERKAEQSAAAVCFFLKGGVFPHPVPDEEMAWTPTGRRPR